MVESFKSTLEFIRESDFLLIINDASDKNMEDKYDIIIKTLKSIGIEVNYLKEKVINVFNKCDLVCNKKQNLNFSNNKNGIFASSFNIDDIKKLKKKIYEFSLNINNK